MTLLVVSSDRFAGHEPPPGHPERPERSDVMRVTAERWGAQGARVAEPEPATFDQLARVHDIAFLDRLASTAGHATMLDPDTFTSPESWRVARLAAGAAVLAVEQVLSGAAARAAALVRPPGHHAGRDCARGFCLLNNAAVAAAQALVSGVPRVAIVDFDVHHGNGTQEIYEADPRVLYVSLHQFPAYPGSGRVSEVGRDDGEGFTVNVPLDAGATDADYDVVFREVVLPVIGQFDPGLVLVSAGFDAHERDPLGGMRLTEAGFARMAQHIVAAADHACAGRLVLITEGGYELTALASSLDATLAVMAGSGERAPERKPDGSRGHVPADAARGERASRQARAVQAPYWRGL